MLVKDLIEELKKYPDDAKVCFYNFMKGDDMYFRDISVAYDDSEIYFNIG